MKLHLKITIFCFLACKTYASTVLVKEKIAVDQRPNHSSPTKNVHNTVAAFDIVAEAASLGVQLTKLYNIQNKFKQFDKFVHDVEWNPSNIYYLRDQMNNIFGKDATKLTKTVNILKSKDSLTNLDIKDILQEVHKAKVHMAENVVKLGAIASAATIIVQVWRLHEVWLVIKDAENVAEESKAKLKEIDDNIRQLTSWATELNSAMKEYENEDRSDRKNKLIKSIRLKVSRMSTTYIDTRAMISELKITIDGKQQILGVYQREQLGNGITNVIHGVTTLAQCVQFYGLLSRGFTVLQSGLVVAFTSLAAANVGMYYMTSNTLQQLGDQLKEINNLEEQLRVIISFIHQTEDWIELND